jgi:cysteine-rich repeat protein
MDQQGNAYFKLAQLVVITSLTTLAGCTTFNSLQPPEGNNGSDELQMSSFCAGEVPTVESGTQLFTTSTQGLANDVSDLGACGLTEQFDGPEGFFTVDVQEGERWRFRASARRTTSDAGMPMSGELPDVALYVLGSCDEGTCVAGSNDCPAGSPETVNLEVEGGGSKRYVGIDTKSPTPISARAFRTNCGNGEQESGETCDDGNDSNQDRCGRGCRALIPSGGQETEPNDDNLQENFVRFDGMSAEVSGQLSGACDLDRYAVQVPSNANLRAVVQGVGGVECEEDNPPVNLRFIDPSSGGTRTVTGKTRPEPMDEDVTWGGTCPEISGHFPEHQIVKNLSSGEYHVVVSTPQTGDAAGSLFVYNLTIEYDT